MTVASTIVRKLPLGIAHRSSQNRRAEINQPQSIFLYNKGIGEADHPDQNINSYMIGHRSKKW